MLYNTLIIFLKYVFRNFLGYNTDIFFGLNKVILHKGVKRKDSIKTLSTGLYFGALRCHFDDVLYCTFTYISEIVSMDTPNKICNESVKYFDKYLFI